jgi:hypothetical protein
MNVDFAIELGAEDEVLEFPWASADGRLRHYDVKRQPELLAKVEEVWAYPELGDFLSRVNSPRSLFETAKCDVWFSSKLSPEEAIYERSGKLGCYGDLIFTDHRRRFSFEEHEALLRQLREWMTRLPEFHASVEFLLRRCYYRFQDASGFYVTCYVFGYGNEQVEAQVNWAIALQLTGNALMRYSGYDPINGPPPNF